MKMFEYPERISISPTFRQKREDDFYLVDRKAFPGKGTEYVRADRIEELEAKLARYNDLVADKIDLKSENISLKAKLAKAVEALDGVMVGGNHLAAILPDNFPPAETEPFIALETMGYGYDFEVWCCWRSIMLARNTLAELTRGKDG